MILVFYLIVCVLILITGFIDARSMVEAYNASQAKLVSGLLVENVNVALDNAVAQIEEVSYAIADGREEDPEVIYAALKSYADRSDVHSTGFIASDLKVYGQAGDQQDLDKLQEYANMNNLGGQAGIYLINCNSLNCIACSDSAYAAAGTWNNLALRQAQMEFADTHDYQFYIAKMQNGIKGDTVQYRVNGVDYTQGYERIDKMKGWYLTVELSDTAMSGSFNMFQDRLMAYGGLLLLATLVACIVLIVMEISQKKSFEKLSSIDAMTGLYNKKTFTALVEDYLTYEKDPGVLIFVDVDNFKIYNDQYGHLNGDAVLKKFARELLEEFSQTGIVGRYGGDEFTVFLKSVSSQEYVNRGMERLEKKLSAIELEEFGEVALSFSAGGARYPQDGSTFVELCKLADDALYRVKADGKGKYYWYQ